MISAKAAPKAPPVAKFSRCVFTFSINPAFHRTHPFDLLFFFFSLKPQISVFKQQISNKFQSPIFKQRFVIFNY